MMKQLCPQSWGVAIEWNIAYLEQDISDKEQSVYDYLMNFVEAREEYKIIMAMEDAWCDFTFDKKISDLSWGQQTRLRIAALFLAHSSILVLDEPTNHLDEKAIERLIDLIKNYDGIVIFVSHDRWFIDQCATQCIEIQDTEIQYYEWNYTAYEKEKQLRFERALQAFKLQERKRKKLEQWLHIMRQRASFYDSPALWKLLKSKEKFYEREFSNKQKVKPNQSQSLTLSSTWGKHKSKLLFRTEKLGIGYRNQ